MLCTTLLCASPAQSEFLVSSAIVEFTADNPALQDIELVSRSKDNDYIVTEVSEVIHPGESSELRREVTDPETGWLLVTPDKTVLTGGSRKVVRFVLLKKPDASEHIYRVAIKPVINALSNDSKVGLKVLVGYEVLVVIRPTTIVPNYTAVREGTRLKVTNRGNSNVLFQHGSQCSEKEKCPLPPAQRIYAGQSLDMQLPRNAPVTYSIWDGKDTVEKTF